jgi:ATPase subunit of ABC transporter with duplicated ATPase domains
MSKCPNCGQNSEGDFCQWCGYPILSDSQIDKERAKREAQEAKKAKEAERQAKKKAEQEAREKAKREAQEAKQAKEAERQTQKKAEQEARERAKREAQEAKQAEEAERQTQKKAKGNIKTEKDLIKESKYNALYEGIVRIVVPQANLDQVKIVEDYLLQIKKIRLLLIGGSKEGGSEFIVSADKPVPLISLLERMKSSEEVVMKGNFIQVTMAKE